MRVQLVYFQPKKPPELYTFDQHVELVTLQEEKRILMEFHQTFLQYPAS